MKTTAIFLLVSSLASSPVLAAMTKAQLTETERVLEAARQQRCLKVEQVQTMTAYEARYWIKAGCRLTPAVGKTLADDDARLRAAAVQQENERREGMRRIYHPTSKEKAQDIANATATYRNFLETHKDDPLDKNYPQNGLPKEIGVCQTLTIASSGERILEFNNAAFLSFYEMPLALKQTRGGDRVRVCLSEKPAWFHGPYKIGPCPPSDQRGSLYSVLILRTGRSFKAADALHQCGGA
jgi:hypothetical protein